ARAFAAGRGPAGNGGSGRRELRRFHLVRIFRAESDTAGHRRAPVRGDDAGAAGFETESGARARRHRGGCVPVARGLRRIPAPGRGRARARDPRGGREVRVSGLAQLRVAKIRITSSTSPIPRLQPISFFSTGNRGSTGILRISSPTLGCSMIFLLFNLRAAASLPRRTPRKSPGPPR